MSDSEIKMVNIADIKSTDKIVYDNLSQDILLRINNLYYTILYEIFPDIDIFIENFKKDANLQNEVKIWEIINLCFQQYSHRYPANNRKKILIALVHFSMGGTRSPGNQFELGSAEYNFLSELWDKNVKLFFV